MRIAIDAMGGEEGVLATIPGIRQALDELNDPHIKFIVFGQKKLIDPLVAKYKLGDSVEVHDVQDVVKDTDHPFKIFQSGAKTSMGKSITAVKEGLADGIVSSGSTGGYVALTHKIFGLMPGVGKIALPAVMPSEKDRSIFLDLGASPIVSENDLVQFAIMGSLLYKAQFGVNDPQVALLNIGTEDIKGPPFITKAHKLLKDHKLVNYKGFIEGIDILKGNVDVIVTDGYAGNIALKTMEGTANFIGDHLKLALGGSIWRKILSLGVLMPLRKFKQKIDRRRYNGAVLLGVNHLAVKSHGNADADAFACAIKIAYKMIQYHLIDQVRSSCQDALDRSVESHV